MQVPAVTSLKNIGLSKVHVVFLAAATELFPTSLIPILNTANPQSLSFSAGLSIRLNG